MKRINMVFLIVAGVLAFVGIFGTIATVAFILVQEAHSQDSGTTSTILMVNSPPEPHVMFYVTHEGQPKLLMEIVDKTGESMVTLDLDGKVYTGKNYKPDETAKMFWEAIGKGVPEALAGACKK